MMAKHTPGDWINDAGLVNGRDSRQRFAGSVSHDIFNAAHWPAELEQEAKANAHLISAAPDMLEALVRFTQMKRPVPTISELNDVRLLAEAAIKKVRGRP